MLKIGALVVIIVSVIIAFGVVLFQSIDLIEKWFKRTRDDDMIEKWPKRTRDDDGRGP
jgi:hypothetical protein